MDRAVLSTAYFGPIQYFCKFLIFDKIEIEQHETYQKQTYRNRCSIIGAGGTQNLTVPVIKINGNNTKVKDIAIDYSTRWQTNHWRSLVSAYNSSPFFEFYAQDIEPFFKNKFDSLLVLNQTITLKVLELLEIESDIEATKGFEKNIEIGSDLRNAISPKLHKTFPDEHFKKVEYTQTFSEKYAFEPNLSILDLLFNQGPESLQILERSCVFSGQ